MLKNNSSMLTHFMCHSTNVLTASKFRKPISKWLKKGLSWLMKRNIRAGKFAGTATSEKSQIPLHSYFAFLGYYLWVNCC